MLPVTRRQTATVVFIVLCVVLVAAAVSLNVGWILRGQRLLPLVLGVIAFALIIAGIIVYTVFLVRELRRTEQQDSFLNAVTHELKTPIASIRLYLETLQAREIPESQRQEFYRVMLDDTTRLQYTVEQVLRAGVASQRRKLMHRAPVDVAALAIECIETARRRHHLADDTVALAAAAPAAAMLVEGDADELRTAIGNLLDNAVKYSADGRAGHRGAGLAVARYGLGAGAGSRRRHPAPAAAAHLQPLLPLPGARLQREGHRPRPLHGAVDRAAARRPRLRRRARARATAPPSRSSCRSWRRGTRHEPHPRRRGRAAPGRRAALQPGRRGPRGRRGGRRRRGAGAAARTTATATTRWCST